MPYIIAVSFDTTNVDVVVVVIGRCLTVTACIDVVIDDRVLTTNHAVDIRILS